MSRLLFIFIVTGFLLPPSTSNAQEITPEADRTWDVESFVLPGGRLGNNVNSIVQGPFGFVWFGSHGGVHRYDGYETITYRNVAWDTIGESSTLTFPYVEHLHWDSHDMLWVSTYGNGIYSFDPKTEKFKHYPYHANNPASVSHPRVLCAIEDTQGQMWFGTERGLNRYDPETESFIQYLQDPDNPKSLKNHDIRKLYIDSEGALWVGTGFAGFVSGTTGALSRYNPETDDFTNYFYDPEIPTSISSSAVRGIAEDSKGNFWIGTANGLELMDRNASTFKLMQPEKDPIYAPGTGERTEPIVYSILEDHDGGLWVGTIMGPNYPTHLTRHDPENKTSQVFPVQTSAWDMTQCADGTIWVAGAGVSGTVLRITPKSITYDLQDGNFYTQDFYQSDLYRQLGIGVELRLEGPLEMVIDSLTGDIWTTHICREAENWPIIAKHNPNLAKTEFYLLENVSGISDAAIEENSWNASGMVIDQNGRIWGSLRSENVGLFYFDPRTKTTGQVKHDPYDALSLSSNFIIRTIIDSKGYLWSGTGGSGLNRLHPVPGEIKRYNFDIPEQFDDNGWVISVMESNDGKIWAAGELHNDGKPFIAILDPVSDQVSRLHLPLGNSFVSIRSMTQSPLTGHIIFTLQGNGIGNYYPDSGEFTFFSQSESTLPMSSIASIVCDNEGTFWASSSIAGEFVRFGESFDYEKFLSREGHPNSNRKGLVGPDGHIYFINGSGWTHIDPTRLKITSTPDTNNIGLVDLYILGEKQIAGKDYSIPYPAPLLESIQLKHEAETFALRFSNFNYHEKNTQFQYRLVPYESIWKTTNIPIANYFRIPGGNYNFQARQLTFSGPTNQELLDIPIKILPPWWKTWWAYLIYGILLILAGFGVHRIQKARVIRAERNRNREKELAHAREIEKAYNDLQNTQAQLLQSEKMASLGELTAGIAHEIQNPLNFVNNFSEVNTELLTELKEEIKQKNYDEVESIADSLEENEQKILHHGHRAGAIVKSMLQHSRSSKGEREEVDLNELADEYLRLAYHGMRAKDKTFNANMKTDFDNDIGKLKLVPQDIGRVILNLITNAFYAVHQKKQKSNGVYAPEVSVSTRSANGKIELAVADNGTGMPEEVANKIFQPFFTTKPTGEGTGLGLSLSYDIIKAHGGELKVDSKVGEGSKFIIELPV